MIAIKTDELIQHHHVNNDLIRMEQQQSSVVGGGGQPQQQQQQQLLSSGGAGSTTILNCRSAAVNTTTTIMESNSSTGNIPIPISMMFGLSAAVTANGFEYNGNHQFLVTTTTHDFISSMDSSSSTGSGGGTGLGLGLGLGLDNNSNTSITSNSSPSSPLLQLAKKFNSFYLNGVAATCLPLIVDHYRIGLVMPNILEQLKADVAEAGDEYPFVLHDDYIEFSPTIDSSYSERSKAIEKLLLDWRDKQLFSSALKGWRNECFEVSCHFDNPSLFKMERSATFLFGIRKYGVDINGYVDHPIHGICLWLQKRSSTKQTWPNKWDNMVGGGLSSGYTVLETACKEAGEEASIPSELLKSNLKAIGTVSYFYHNERGLSPNTEFVFDLELPLNFHPINSDGEVDEFNLVTHEEALRIACGPDFKTTSCPVLLDFLIRHNLINEVTEPNLMEVKKLLNVPLETFYYREKDEEEEE